MPDHYSPDDAATLAALSRLTPPPRPEFARSLKEELMHASTIPTPTLPEPTVPDPRTGARHRVRLLPFPGRGAIGSRLATAALLLVTLAGAVTMRQIAPPSPAPTQLAAVAPPATPPAEGPVEMCGSTDIYFGCPRLAQAVGAGHVPLADLAALPDGVETVQLGGMALAPGARYTPDADLGNGGGLAMDVVLTGAYQATFDVPVIVAPGGMLNRGYAYIEPNTMVELVAGDSVTYALGGLVELSNPLQTERLELKRATISAGEVVLGPLPDGVTANVEATGTLPQPLTNSATDVSLGLWYVQVREGAFPPPAWQGATTFVLGPTDPQRGPTGTEGFVLVIRETQG